MFLSENQLVVPTRWKINIIIYIVRVSVFEAAKLQQMSKSNLQYTGKCTQSFIINTKQMCSYPKIDHANLKGTLWTFKEWPTLKQMSALWSFYSPINVLI